MSEKIKFNIQMNRVLDLLCSQIYDSPLALLRENVQNAYDAILMRQSKKESKYQPQICVEIFSDKIIIKDNGIGMDSKILKNNFWTAGSSGKNTEEAKNAGVIGTFGIGAMANFGVCKSIRVITRAYGSNVTYTSYVDKDKLSLNENSIIIEENVDNLLDYGTQIVAILDENVCIQLNEAMEYLIPYVEYLPVPVVINNENISQKILNTNGSKNICEHKDEGWISFDYKVSYFDKAKLIPQIYLTNLVIKGNLINGCVFLEQNAGILFGLRNYFGLAPVPIYTTFNLGGIVNLPTLVPTAGREAVSRESIEEVAKIVKVAERIIAETLAADEFAADNSRELLAYIKNNKRYDLAYNVCIGTADNAMRYPLKMCQDTISGKMVYYYEGNDNSIINNLLNGENVVLVPANDYIRRHIQLNVLKRQKVKLIKDNIKVDKIRESDYTFQQWTIVAKIKMILQEDYFLPNVQVCFGTISHQLNIFLSNENGSIAIYLTKDSDDVLCLTKIIDQNFGYFEPMVKEFIRNKIYPNLSPYIPSSIKGDLNALYDTLQKNKDLYIIDANELGEVKSVMVNYVDGKTDFKQVLQISKLIKNKQIISVGSSQVGDITINLSQHLDKSDILYARTIKNTQEEDELCAKPPIMRDDVQIKHKVLIGRNENETINGYNTFLAVSDKMFERYSSFFRFPHSMRVIWSMHKIIYIFTLVDNKITLYYDIELEKKLRDNEIGGDEFRSSTIITKDKIFIPVINKLADYFNISTGQLKFTVRFDIVNG
ncbi:MAG: ATP-binding protein [Paludibacteraceae bacterium]|nr:ATP-binding protein [Paludibacteraceae bacterium]